MHTNTYIYNIKMDRFFKRRSTHDSENTQEETKEEPTNSNESQEEKKEPHFRRRRQQDNYNEFRNENRRNDYVPINKIEYVFSHHFPNSSMIHEINQDIKLCSIKILDLLNTHITNWELNRNPDIVRIPEIAKYIYESRTRIHTIFYLNYNFKEDRFELIDGVHRYQALKMIKSLSEENGIIIDDRLRGEDGENIATWFNPNESIDWLLNINIISQINFISTDEQLIILRDDINNSRPMPYDARPVPPEPIKYRIINEIADEYNHRYKKWFANSIDYAYLRNNRKTNRDNFVKLLSKLYDKYNINLERAGSLKQRLEIANDKIRIELQENKIRCNDEVKTRCRQTGFYLFLYRDDKLLEII